MMVKQAECDTAGSLSATPACCLAHASHAGPSGAAAPATAAAAAPNPEEIELSDGEEGDDAGGALSKPLGPWVWMLGFGA